MKDFLVMRHLCGIFIGLLLISGCLRSSSGPSHDELARIGWYRLKIVPVEFRAVLWRTRYC